MKRILITLLLSIITITTYAQVPFGLNFNSTKEEVIASLDNQGIKYEQTDKNKLRIITDTEIEAETSQFDGCILFFKKNKFYEVELNKQLAKNEERVVMMKFQYLSKKISDKYLMRRYMEKLRDGYYSGWKDNKTNVMLKWEKNDNGYNLALIYSTKGLF